MNEVSVILKPRLTDLRKGERNISIAISDLSRKKERNANPGDSSI